MSKCCHCNLIVCISNIDVGIRSPNGADFQKPTLKLLEQILVFTKEGVGFIFQNNVSCTYFSLNYEYFTNIYKSHLNCLCYFWIITTTSLLVCPLIVDRHLLKPLFGLLRCGRGMSKQVIPLKTQHNLFVKRFLSILSLYII